MSQIEPDPRDWAEVLDTGCAEEVTVEDDRVTVIGDRPSTHANGRSSFAFDLDGDQITRMTIREG